jgi:putative ATPase
MPPLPDPAPLADRLRPRRLEDFVGQDHIIGLGKPLRRLIEQGKLASVIFWGPPGTGKTTLAHLIASRLEADFVPFSAVTSGVADLRNVIERAEQNQRLGQNTILFIDEIHRWNKGQQDALLPHVEQGRLILIGATTENPSFEVVGALLSRTQVYRLHELSEAQLAQILKRALTDKESGVGDQKLKLEPGAKEFLLGVSAGDARGLLNTLELAAQTAPVNKVITRTHLEEILVQKAARYDKKGEDHYNVISAFIKSMRGSDPDATVYYLARMIDAGENPVFIARRMVVFASEDIGNADPQALVLAVAAYHAVHFIGMPEARINLSQAAIYLATALKSNASYRAVESALSEVRQSGAQPVPLHLRNAPTKLMRDEGYKKGYQYAHSDEHAVVTHHHLPDSLKDHVFYDPGDRGLEVEIKQHQAELGKLRSQKPPKR